MKLWNSDFSTILHLESTYTQRVSKVIAALVFFYSYKLDTRENHIHSFSIK